MTIKHKSTCCNAEVIPNQNDNVPHTTIYYICTKCEYPCETIPDINEINARLESLEKNVKELMSKGEW